MQAQCSEGCSMQRERNFSSSQSTFDCPSREIVHYYHLYECPCWYCSCHHQNSGVLIKRRASSILSLSLCPETHEHSLPAILLPALAVTEEWAARTRERERKRRKVDKRGTASLQRRRLRIHDALDSMKATGINETHEKKKKKKRLQADERSRWTLFRVLCSCFVCCSSLLSSTTRCKLFT